jgi:penicillin-binding protein 1C
VADLAISLFDARKISQDTRNKIINTLFVLAKPKAIINATHFINFVEKRIAKNKLAQSQIAERKATGQFHTTLDGHYQKEIQKIIDTYLQKISDKNVNNGAVLVLNHQTNEVISWVVAFAGKKGKAFNSYDPIQVLRQPGSTLKPYLYARAFERGYEASTLINDSELIEGIGLGSHTYRNYSNNHYGNISVRESLANSLNIPAVKTLRFLGTQDFLTFLKRFGIMSLQKHPDYYGDGLALGNSEVTLLELTRAYSTLARMGNFKKLSVLENEHQHQPETTILDEKIASLIADILSDPIARSKEFGFNSILNLPNQTAVKTGTSSDYRDAWVFGYDDKYTVGIWFGNLNYESMKKITGSKGPAVIMKTTFSLLNKHRETKALYLSNNLIKKRDKKNSDEYYLKETITEEKESEQLFKIIQPSRNLIMARDPRIPDSLESYIFKIENGDKFKSFTWQLNGKTIAITKEPELEWFIKQGSFTLEVNGDKVHFSVQ